LATSFRDEADVIDYLSEIPLPGRTLAPAAAHGDSRPPESRSFGFIAGAENRLVASAVNRLIQPIPGNATPKLLALFGRSGTGKTHLAHGLVRHWNTNRGDGTAIYLTAGDFYRGLLDAIKRETTGEFHRSLRRYQLLAIDDLHQLPDDAYVSRELRFMLDVFEEIGGTVVVTSRRSANTLANLSADVRSRLAAGLSLQLAAPAGAARVHIIRRAAETLGRSVSEQTASQLAASVDGTANDLFGALFELCASAGRDEVITPRAVRQPQLRDIIAVVARHFGVPQKQLKSGSRRQSIVTARAVAIYLARELTRYSYGQIGRSLGGRDHTTIMHNYHKIENERTQDPTIQEAIEVLTRAIRTH
jgi:chromosomal replication initiator protein